MADEVVGMCYRMVFDAGLHVDPGSLNMPERDTQIRHMVLWACMTTDRRANILHFLQETMADKSQTLGTLPGKTYNTQNLRHRAKLFVV